MKPELIEYVMRKLYIGEIEFKEFMDSQGPLDPEFQPILDEYDFPGLKSPTSRKRMKLEGKLPKQLDMYIDL